MVVIFQHSSARQYFTMDYGKASSVQSASGHAFVLWVHVRVMVKVSVCPSFLDREDVFSFCHYSVSFMSLTRTRVHYEVWN